MKNDILEIITQHKYEHISSEQAVSELLDLFGVMHRSFQGSNGYAIEHLINDTYQVVDRIDGTVHHQGTKRDCEVYLNGA
jgi:hypothetical protein